MPKAFIRRAAIRLTARALRNYSLPSATKHGASHKPAILTRPTGMAHPVDRLSPDFHEPSHSSIYSV